MSTPPSYSIGDYEYAYYKNAVPPASMSSGGSAGSGIVTNSPLEANQYESKVGVGTSTAPAAAANIVSNVTPSAGFFEVLIKYGYGATAESAAADNFQLVVNATVKNPLLAVVGAANTLWDQKQYIKLTAGDVVRIQAVAAGSAGAIYKASVTLNRLS